MKHDVSNIIKQANERGLSCYRIANTASISPTTVRNAMLEGRMVNSATCNNITRAIVMLDQQARELGDVAFNQGHEVSTEQLAANLEKQVDALRDTITGSGLVDDAIESAHSREVAQLKADLACTEKRHDDAQDLLFFERKKNAELQTALVARINEVENLATDLAHERQKNETQYQSIGQCFAEIHRLQDNLKDAQSVIAVQEKQIDLGLDEIDRLKRLVALRTQDLSIYQKALEDADNRAADADYKSSELERDLTVQRAWTWFFVLLAFVAATVGVIK